MKEGCSERASDSRILPCLTRRWRIFRRVVSVVSPESFSEVMRTVKHDHTAWPSKFILRLFFLGCCKSWRASDSDSRRHSCIISLPSSYSINSTNSHQATTHASHRSTCLLLTLAVLHSSLPSMNSFFPSSPPHPPIPPLCFVVTSTFPGRPSPC